MERRCSGYGVTMEPVKLRTGEGFKLQIDTDERREGLLGSLGTTANHSVEGRLYPECGLVRACADIDE
jgi:hypothetical protein